MECPACQHDNSDSAKFCEECGQKLTPAHKTEGERRRATIVFSDLSGYTAMNERLDPEEVAEIMGRIKAEAVAIVEGHGGTVNQFVGDEVVALFGIPTAHEDDPLRAVRAALALHGRVRGMSDEVAAHIGQPLTMHTGINTGLIVTRLEDARDGRYGLTGDAVNTGARLLAQAGADEILLSPDTQALVAPFVETEALPPVAMKGKAEPMVPHRVRGEVGVRTRFEAAAARGLSAFAGRESELAALNGCLEATRQGKGQLVTICGEAGVGKSRLLHEFRQGLPAEVILLTGRCTAAGANTPYLPFLHLLRDGAGISDDDASPSAVDKLAVHLQTLEAPAATDTLPLLLHLLSLHSEAHPLPEGLEGEALGRALRGALSGYVLQHATQHPTVLLLEDWHWVDEASNEVLHDLTRQLADYPLLLAVLYRPEHEGDWPETDTRTHLDLQPLDAAHTAALIASTLEAGDLPEGLAARIHEHTGGNPFFTEEVCRALAETGVVTVRDGRAGLTTALEAMTLPGTVQAVVQSRLDRLEHEAREAVRLAAVIGREFAMRLLERIHPASDRLPSSLDHLQLLAIIFRTHAQPDAAYIFKHVITQQVAYETLLLKRRRELHTLVGQAIEALHTNNLEPHYEALSHHFSNGDDLDKAVEYMWHTANQRIRKRAHSSAFEIAKEAHHRLITLEMTPERKYRFTQVANALGNASWGRPDAEAMAVLEQSIEYCIELNELERAHLARFFLATCNLFIGRMDRAKERYRENIALAHSEGNREWEFRNICLLGRMQMETGELPLALKSLEDGNAVLDELGFSREVIVHDLEFTFCRGLQGHLNTALDEILKDKQKHTGEGVVGLQARACLYAGLLLCLKGDWPGADAEFTEGMTLMNQTEFSPDKFLLTGTAGFAKSWNGNSQEGILLLKKGIEGVEALGSTYHLPLLHGMLAEGHFLTGEFTLAAACAIKTLELQWTGFHFGKQFALRVLAIPQVSVESGKTGNYLEPMQELTAWLEENQLYPDLAIAHFRQAEILHQQDDQTGAMECVALAEPQFTQMDMTWWTEQAVALRGRIGRGEPFRGFAPHVEG